jgi:all-trans-retinol 13,14-reductase
MSGGNRNSYDDVVVGAGTAGLTAALLLARFGRSVLLVDGAPAPGGGLRRFRRSGAAFDTGFHFTGSVLPGELFDHLLMQLGIRDALTLVPFDAACAHRFRFRNEQATVDVPAGIEQARASWQARFPAEAASIDWYFQSLRSIAERTTGMSTVGPLRPFGMLDEDFISLRSVLDHRFRDPVLKGAISAFSMCHGSPPARVSFAAHARVAYGMHQSVGTLAGGGDALAGALAEAALRAGVEIRCGCRLEAFDDIVEGQPRRARFSGGQSVTFSRCLMTMDPAQILERLAPVRPSPAFRERVRAFEPSVGFFVAYGVVDGTAPLPGFARSIHSEFPDVDFDAVMDPAYPGERPLVVIEVPADAGTGAPPSISALELSFPRDVAAWADSRVGRRPEAYRRYKRQRAGALQARLGRMLPYAARVRWVETASMLTFRDYLDSSCGSAYGIMQQVGQYGLFGRLPGRNLYAAGQSALLPGVLGAMMSGLLVARLMVGRERFDTTLIEAGGVRG